MSITCRLPVADLFPHYWLTMPCCASCLFVEATVLVEDQGFALLMSKLSPLVIGDESWWGNDQVAAEEVQKAQIHIMTKQKQEGSWILALQVQGAT